MHVRTLLPKLMATLAVAAGGLAPLAQADINVGVTLSATGPAASLGIPEKNTFELLPTTIGGQKINWIVLDDGSDTTKAVTNTKKLISEDKVDVIVGSTITPELARDGRRGRRRRDADDLDGGVRAHRRSGESQDQMGVQDAAERLADGRRDRHQHEGERREDDGVHRLRRRLRRRLARGNAALGGTPPASRSSARRSTTAPTPPSRARC